MHEVIKTADWVLDLGPEGGDKGGEVVAEGTPEQVTARNKLLPAPPDGAFSNNMSSTHPPRPRMSRSRAFSLPPAQLVPLCGPEILFA
jgi:hypothetical protein